MGIEIDRERFDEADYVSFTERLDHCLAALEQLLEPPRFGVGPRTIGTELLERYLELQAGGEPARTWPVAG